MKKDAVILILEPNQTYAAELAAAFRSRAASVEIADSFEAAQVLIHNRSLDLVVASVDLDNSAGGLDVLGEVHSKSTAIPVILISSSPDINTCKEALKLGAYDYFVQPVSVEDILRSAQKAVPAALTLRGLDDFVFPGVFSRSPAMQSLYRVLRRVSVTDMPILIEGESGTGKELTAKAVHLNSKRKDKPFYPINCAGLTESLLESELFGHVKGSFTGATVDRKGLFQAADRGTLFLDEIGDMPLAMQAKLLRVLEDGLVTPVGGTSPVKVDVRFISATNHDLARLVDEKKFRQDLYFRIRGVSVTLPPLRNRPLDIPELFGFFLKEACEELSRDIHLITEPAMRAMMSFEWPGNIRQLRNTIKVMVAMCERDTLDLRDLPPEIARIRQLQAPEGVSSEHIYEDMVGKSLQEVEREHIRRTLEFTAQNRTEAAKILQIGERTLYRKIKEYGL